MTSPSAREFTEMSASVAVKKETEMSLTTQREANIIYVTTSERTTMTLNAKHLVMIAGNSVSLRCTSSVDVTFHWHYWSIGSLRSVSIYNGKRVDHGAYPAASFSVSNCGTRTCTLAVGKFHLRDTGTVACLGGNVNKYWLFTILRK